MNPTKHGPWQLTCTLCGTEYEAERPWSRACSGCRLVLKERTKRESQLRWIERHKAAMIPHVTREPLRRRHSEYRSPRAARDAIRAIEMLKEANLCLSMPEAFLPVDPQTHRTEPLLCV